MAGDADTGVCIMRMEAGLDTGPVLLREALSIGAEDTTGDLHDRLAVLGARLVVTALAGLDRLEPEAQPERASPTRPRSTRPRPAWTGRAPPRRWTA
jgi:methionyl-tRNA formyltransferase